MKDIRAGEISLTISERIRAAFLGAAVGDALGWPQEQRGGRVGGRGTVIPDLKFREWKRRSGGRFLPHEETIRPGEYSDDTQLLICTARSILRGKSWLQHFVQEELPAWSVYQRGAGGAVKRAAEAWASGKCPWSEAIPDEDRRRYFQAGGNGVVMRIMPHVAVSSNLNDFSELKLAILLNGITTHGHPRALIGAVVYGYVGWIALRNNTTLPYGMLIEAALDNRNEWTTLPDLELLPDDWSLFAKRSFDAEPQIIWDRTANETVDLLTRVRRGIHAGALAIDEDILRGLGCFDSSVNGAGTVSAAGSIYLASKYAPDPSHGIVGAAFAKGADTDTLASMTGALLGLVGGLDWLQNAVGPLEDSEFLQSLGAKISAFKYDEIKVSEITACDRRTDIKRFVQALEVSHIGESVHLPDGRQGAVVCVDSVATKSKSLSGNAWVINTDDGQTLHVKKLKRQPAGSQGQLGFREPELARPTSSVQAIKVRVGELPRARKFYGDILGLGIVRESKNAINFGGILTVVPADYESGLRHDQPGQSIICVETDDLDLCREFVVRGGVQPVKPIDSRAGRRFFACFDPDGNVVEVYERAANGIKGQELQSRPPA